MTTTAFITLEDIRANKSIALNIQQAKELTPYILEAQNFDLSNMMGEVFYLDLVTDFTASPSLTKYAILFNGGTYTYNSESYYNWGIKNLIIYYAYKRYLINSNVIATPTGFKTKTNPHSEGISDKTLARLVSSANSSALFVEDSVKHFLQRNNTDYPLYNYKCVNKTNRTKIRQV